MRFGREEAARAAMRQTGGMCGRGAMQSVVVEAFKPFAIRGVRGAGCKGPCYENHWGGDPVMRIKKKGRKGGRASATQGNRCRTEASTGAHRGAIKASKFVIRNII